MRTFFLRKENIRSAIENGRKLLRRFSKQSTLNVKVCLRNASTVQCSTVQTYSFITSGLDHHWWSTCEEDPRYTFDTKLGGNKSEMDVCGVEKYFAFGVS